jgi:ABC-type nitrate/sulfonate/bicarbonate transport system permease component
LQDLRYLFLIQLRGGLEIAAMLLMLLGTQWYILFNVIAGAMAVPTDLKEVARIFCFTTWDRWRFLVLPAIFPYLITDMITASGGAWNASIVAEYFHFQGGIGFRPRPRQHHQSRQRFRALRCTAGRHRDHGHHRRAHESPGVAPSVSVSFNALQA